MKNKFIVSTIILILGGAINKILAMIIKIFLTRVIGESGISLYMFILPTFNLFITLTTLSIATSISKLIAEKGHGKKIILSLLPLSLLYSFGMMIIIILLAPIIAKYFLNNINTKLPLMGIGFTLPFITFSNLLKGYYYGKERMVPYVISNIIEQIVRLMCIVLLIPKLINYDLSILIFAVVVINVVSELASIIILIIFMPKSNIFFKDFKFDRDIFKDILNISLANTGSRLIGSISYFLEPIILTNILLYVGFDNSYISSNYGIITGYVFSLLLIPSFFGMAISTSLLPVVANNYSKKRYCYVKKKLNQSIAFSLMIGLFFTIIFMCFPEFFLRLIYNTKSGVNYIRFIAPFFIIHYIQGPLTAFLQAIGLAKKAMMGTLYGAIIKNILLFVLCIFYGIWGFIIADIINIMVVTINHIIIIRKEIKCWN